MGRQVFRSIAHQIRRYHRSYRYCGDIYRLIRISMPGFVVSFPFGPHPTTDLTCFSDGVLYDMIHFRYLVAMLMKADLKANGVFVKLPIDFQYFFSRIFVDYMVDRSEACFHQMFHPLFFNGEDRCHFVGTVVDF